MEHMRAHFKHRTKKKALSVKICFLLKSCVCVCQGIAGWSGWKQKTGSNGSYVTNKSLCASGFDEQFPPYQNHFPPNGMIPFHRLLWEQEKIQK